jgi:hypothetical protein
MMSIIKNIILILSAVFITVSCASRLGDIDQTRPNIVQKSSLDGEWYYRQMITDIQSLASYDSGGIIGYSSNLIRVRWEVEEQFLVAIALDEFTPGTNDVGADRELDEYVVAKYPITGHFDIRRQYNHQTGEENNVMYEDGSSRKWYERESMRVNWAENKASSFLALTFKGQSAHMVQRESTSDEDPYMIDITDDHINVTTEHVLSVYDYVSSKVQMFTSIVKIDNDADYIPWDFPAQVKQRDATGNVIVDEDGDAETTDLFTRYGFFQTVRQTYDRYDAEVWNNRKYYINRFDIWQESTDALGNPLPLAQRIVKPILYFIAEDYPVEMIPAAKRIGELWNQGFVQALKDVGYPITNDTVAFDVCENPVTETSSNACQTAGLGLKLFGDLRYNFLKLARPKGTVNPLGFGPGSHDQRTGQTINAWSVTYYAALNTYAKRALDMVKMYNGEINSEDREFLEGDYFEGLQASLEGQFGEDGDDEHNHAHGNMHQNAQFETMLRNMNRDTQENPEMIKFMQQAQGDLNQAMNGQSLMQMMANRDYSATDGKFTDATIEQLEGLLPPMMDGGTASEQLLDSVRHNPAEAFVDQLVTEDERMREFSDNNMYMEEFADPTVGYIAARIAKKYPYPAEGTPNRDQLILELDRQILTELKNAIYIGVMLHEVGHNLGLRHNFAGSTDELNFIQPGVGTPIVGADVFAGEDSDVMQGYWNVVTEAQPDVSKRLEYQYSSIMDYGAGFTSDIHGLGAYDIAAIRFGYLGHIEVFEGGTHPTLAAKALGESATESAQAQAKYQALQSRSFMEWDADAVQFEDETYLEYVDVGGQKKYLNRHEFCTDTFADGFNIMCSRWDVGRDPIEITTLYGERFKHAYWFMNYRRNKVYGDNSFSGSIVNGTFRRYFWYAARVGILASYINESYGLKTSDILQDLDAYGGLAYYSLMGGYALNEMMNVLMTPDVGTYEWTTGEDDVDLLAKNSSDGTVTIDNHDGAHPRYSKYFEGKDEYWEVSRYGYFNNKIGAMLALFMGMGINLEQFAQSEVLAGYSTLSLATAFEGETIELLNSYLQGYAPRFGAIPLAEGGTGVAQAGGQIGSVVPSNRVYNDLLRAFDQPSPTDVEYPRVSNSVTGYEFQYALLFANAYLPSFNDRQWIRWLRVSRKGDIYSSTYADPTRVVEWSDEGTGAVWQAYKADEIKTLDGRPVQPSVTSNYLEFVTAKLVQYDLDIVNNVENAQLFKNYFLDNVRYKLDFMYNLQRL